MNTKFNIGDTVWWIAPKQEIQEGVVGIIQIEKDQAAYRVYDSSNPEGVFYYWLQEDSLYATKEEAVASIRKLKCPSLGKLAYCISPVYGNSAADGIISYKVEKVVPIERKADGVSALVYYGSQLNVKYVSFNDLFDDEAMAMLEAANRINRNSRKDTNSGLRSYASSISRLIQDKVEEAWKKIFPETESV